MTLIVGILCEDGAVVAADRQVSHGAMGVMTVGQPGTKVEVLGDSVLVASSGSAALAQATCAKVEQQRSGFRGGPYSQRINALQAEIRNEILLPALQMASVAKNVYGPAAAQSARVSSILAAEFRDGLKVVEIEEQGACSYLTPNIPFTSLGSGKRNADPFLRNLWSVYWPEELPTVKEGILAALWTVEAVIELRTEGVGFQTDVFTMERDQSGHFKAKQVEQEELVDNRGFIEEAKEAMRSVRDTIRGIGSRPPEAPPELPEEPS